MFRKMRRYKQELSFKECEKILSENNTGILGVIGDEGYPYTVPLNYVYYDDKIYFHSAKVGHKIDAINSNGKISFCVIDKDEVFEEKLTTKYRSVIIFGKAKIIKNANENKKFVEIFSKKYTKDIEKIMTESKNEKENFYMVEIKIEKLSGKQAIELLKG